MADNFPTSTSQLKMLIADFDGTLAGAEHIVTPRVKKAVRRWIDSGRFFTIATGRQFLMIDDECKKMDLTDPVIVRGGAEVVDPKNGEILHAEYIQSDIVTKILKFIDQGNLFLYSIEIDDLIYTNFTIDIPFPKITFKKLADFEIRSVPKIHLRPKNEKNFEQDEFVKKIAHISPDVHAIATHNSKFGRGWDITSVKATKLHGIVKVLEHLGLRRENLVGVGDSYNDFPLLEAAHLKVAMGNANDELKAIADVTVPSHEEDGVAHLITKLLENTKS